MRAEPHFVSSSRSLVVIPAMAGIQGQRARAGLKSRANQSEIDLRRLGI
jgi:hypothetical protein